MALNAICARIVNHLPIKRKRKNKKNLYNAQRHLHCKLEVLRIRIPINQTRIQIPISCLKIGLGPTLSRIRFQIQILSVFRVKLLRCDAYPDFPILWIPGPGFLHHGQNPHHELKPYLPKNISVKYHSMFE